MPEKTKEKEKEEKTGVVEKRVKATVIRRRAAKPAPGEAPPAEAPKEAKEAEAPKEAAAPPAPVAKPAPTPAPPPAKPATAAPAKEAAPARAVEAGERAEKKPRKGREKAEAASRKFARKEKEKAPTEILEELKAEEAEELPVITPPAEAPAEKPVEAAPAAEAEARPHKKEVKVFEKEGELKKFFAQKRPARREKTFPARAQRKGAPVQPLKKLEPAAPMKAAKKVIRIVDAISVADLSQRLGVKAGEIIKKLMSLGILATVNQLIDIDAVTLIAQDYGFEVESAAVGEEALIEPGAEEAPGEVKLRPPVVTVMGHVDHGKTSLLDAIRKTNVVSGEAGGITQHIGAYHVHLEKGDVTFLDTPGHEAFTAMRARGAKVTDLVILVVAADDGVMPQTVEAINHAKAAGVPILVAINKVDLPQADPSRVRNELMSYGLLSEELGGETIFVEVSAKKGVGIKELLEMVLLQAEMLELKANYTTPARGVIVEAKLDKGRGPVATVLIQNGTLKVGDAFVTGLHHGRVRAMISDWGKRLEDAGPSMPVEILGLSGVPDAGDTFIVVKDESTARQIAALRHEKTVEKDRLKTAKVSLADLYEKINKGEVKELNLIIKADVHGSIEAVKDTLTKLSTEAIKIKVIHSGVGGISEGDVMLASASNAIVVGFNVRPEPKASALAEKEKVDLRLYNIIYNLVDDIKNAMEGMLAPVMREETIGRAEVRDVFRITKVGNVAGCYVTDGKVQRTAHVRLIRDNVVIYDGKLSSLKRFKDDVREVATGFECGMTIEGYNDIKAGDILEFYMIREEAAKL